MVADIGPFLRMGSNMSINRNTLAGFAWPHLKFDDLTSSSAPTS